VKFQKGKSGNPGGFILYHRTLDGSDKWIDLPWPTLCLIYRPHTGPY